MVITAAFFYALEIGLRMAFNSSISSAPHQITLNGALIEEGLRKAQSPSQKEDYVREGVSLAAHKRTQVTVAWTIRRFWFSVM